MRTVVKTLTECTKQELDTFETLVKAGGQVQPGLRNRIEHNAERLAFHLAEDGTIMAVAALKRPYASYKKKVFLKAKTHENPDNFALELG